MSGMDGLPDSILEETVLHAEAQLYADMARELLAHRRASHTQPTGTELRPCPFCGSADLKEWAVYVQCNKCQALGPDADFLEAVEAWNRRASQAAPAPKETCTRCMGNGEIVTDWDAYLHPPKDATEEAVADCPDCDGTGRVVAAPAPSDGLREAAWSDEACLRFAEGYDREDAAQRGESDPHSEGGDDYADWAADRISCVRSGLGAMVLAKIKADASALSASTAQEGESRHE